MPEIHGRMQASRTAVHKLATSHEDRDREWLVTSIHRLTAGQRNFLVLLDHQNVAAHVADEEG